MIRIGRLSLDTALNSERGLEADHTTIGRWVQRYGPELEQRLRRHLKPTHKSWCERSRKGVPP